MVSTGRPNSSDISCSSWKRLFSDITPALKNITPSHSTTNVLLESNCNSLVDESPSPRTKRFMAVVKEGSFKKILPIDWKTKRNLDNK